MHICFITTQFHSQLSCYSVLFTRPRRAPGAENKILCMLKLSSHRSAKKNAAAAILYSVSAALSLLCRRSRLLLLLFGSWFTFCCLCCCLCCSARQRWITRTELWVFDRITFCQRGAARRSRRMTSFSLYTEKISDHAHRTAFWWWFRVRVRICVCVCVSVSGWHCCWGERMRVREMAGSARSWKYSWRTALPDANKFKWNPKWKSISLGSKNASIKYVEKYL